MVDIELFEVDGDEEEDKEDDMVCCIWLDELKMKRSIEVRFCNQESNNKKCTSKSNRKKINVSDKTLRKKRTS